MLTIHSYFYCSRLQIWYVYGYLNICYLFWNLFIPHHLLFNFIPPVFHLWLKCYPSTQCIRPRPFILLCLFYWQLLYSYAEFFSCLVLTCDFCLQHKSPILFPCLMTFFMFDYTYQPFWFPVICLNFTVHLTCNRLVIFAKFYYFCHTFLNICGSAYL